MSSYKLLAASAAFVTPFMAFIPTVAAAIQPSSSGAEMLVCATYHQSRKIYYHSAIQPGHRANLKRYAAAFDSYVKKEGLVSWDGAECVIGSRSDMEAHLAALRQACEDCSTQELVRVGWTAQDGAFRSVPAEIAAPLAHMLNVPIDMTPATWVQVRHQFFLCNGDDVRLSYAVIPSKGIAKVDFQGNVFPINAPFQAQGAKPATALGCGAQSVSIGSLNEYRNRLIQHQFTNGQAVWSEEDMIRHFLATLSAVPDRSRKIP